MPLVITDCAPDLSFTMAKETVEEDSDSTEDHPLSPIPEEKTEKATADTGTSVDTGSSRIDLAFANTATVAISSKPPVDPPTRPKLATGFINTLKIIEVDEWDRRKNKEIAGIPDTTFSQQVFIYYHILDRMPRASDNVYFKTLTIGTDTKVRIVKDDPELKKLMEDIDVVDDSMRNLFHFDFEHYDEHWFDFLSLTTDQQEVVQAFCLMYPEE